MVRCGVGKLLVFERRLGLISSIILLHACSASNESQIQSSTGKQNIPIGPSEGAKGLFGEGYIWDGPAKVCNRNTVYAHKQRRQDDERERSEAARTYNTLLDSVE
jgi:hypothetical protein